MSRAAETIPGLFVRQAKAFGRKPLFWAKRSGHYQPMTWEQAREEVEAFSAFLLDRQTDPGDRVLILSENRPEWGMADLAIQSVGAWTVPIYPTLTADGLLVICRDCQPVMAVVSNTEQVDKLLQLGIQVPSLHSIVAMDETARRDPKLLRWSEAVTRGRDVSAKLRDLLEHRRLHLNPDETATLIYTSGTTGDPKGVMLSHRNFLSNAQASLEVIPVTERDLHLSFLPLSHVFERMAGWYLMLMAGASVAYAQTMETIPANMLEIHPTIMLGVPRFFEKLYARIQEGMRQASPGKRRVAAWAVAVGQEAAARRMAAQPLSLGLRMQQWLARRLVCSKFQSRLGGRLRFFVSGGAPLAKEIGEFFFNVGVTILEGYGLTETSPVIAVNRLPLPRFGSVGPSLPGVEVWIADDGEILTRGPHIMQGYYKKPTETAEVLVDGWLHTGDIGHLDEQGYLYITDRKKDLIKTAGGKFVAPQKLENLFVTDAYISQAFVYGDREPYCVALIVPNADQLLRYAREQTIAGSSVAELVRDPRVQEFYWRRVQERQAGLPGVERVKKIALLDQEFTQAAGELTPTLKSKRQQIAQRCGPILRSLYAAPQA